MQSSAIKFDSKRDHLKCNSVCVQITQQQQAQVQNTKENIVAIHRGPFFRVGVTQLLLIIAALTPCFKRRDLHEIYDVGGGEKLAVATLELLLYFGNCSESAQQNRQRTTRCETQSKMLRKRKSGKWSFENVS